MKNKCMLFSLLFGMLPLSMMAQDDMYFVTGKQKKAETTSEPRSDYAPVQETYYSGSNRDVDEYNRRGGSSYEVLPADTGDIISFDPVKGVYPDSLTDFKATREMTRWDGYTPTEDYWEGYNHGSKDSRATWHSPWYYSSYYPWYDSWYWDPWYYDRWYWDPWYYSSWHYGWYDPWYYRGYWGWGTYYHYGWGGYYGGGWYHGGGYVYNSGWRGGRDYHTVAHGTGYGRNSGSVTGTRRASRFGGRTTATASASGRSGIGTTRGTSVARRSGSSVGVRQSSSGSYSGDTYSAPRSSGSRSTYSGSSSTYSGSSTRSSGSSFGGGGGFSSGSRSMGGGGGSFGGGGGGGTRSGSSRR